LFTERSSLDDKVLSYVLHNYYILTFVSFVIFSLFGWLVADGWCWFVLREEYCWLIAAGCWWLVSCERKVLLAGG
jgi:hypothetical protein